VVCQALDSSKPVEHGDVQVRHTVECPARVVRCPTAIGPGHERAYDRLAARYATIPEPLRLDEREGDRLRRVPTEFATVAHRNQRQVQDPAPVPGCNPRRN
jgi:hypothetical protein